MTCRYVQRLLVVSMWKKKKNTMLHILSNWKWLKNTIPINGNGKIILISQDPIYNCTFQIICYHARVGKKNNNYLLARPPPGGRVGMPLSVDRFLITVTKSGNPTSSGRESISKTTPDIVIQDSVTRAALSQEQSGRAE